ncbi:DNA-directed RNA polymerase sigma-70 factor (plasmid) [Fulvitalea axinellae]|uniref:DNA-directed RNA polymerase sigma-70 factor n=1 Tax=Fulvitalea axinellae TaxID=1182444 RepID=A0AAU9CZN6_9BACT|nr:DNA-directed RNA polymerase sigma-70 factor [Fulvitalea axinellae]
MYGDDFYLERLREGSLVAYEYFFNRYSGVLFGYAFHLLQDRQAAEDLVQDVYLKLWNNKAKLRPSASLKPYLFRSAFNAYMDMRRHLAVREKFDRRFFVEPERTSDDNADSPMIITEMGERITEALDTLTESQRAVFVKCKMEGKKYSDVAEEMGVSIKTVEAHMTKAKKKLGVALRDYAPAITVVLLLGRDFL